MDGDVQIRQNVSKYTSTKYKICAKSANENEYHFLLRCKFQPDFRRDNICIQIVVGIIIIPCLNLIISVSVFLSPSLNLFILQCSLSAGNKKQQQQDKCQIL